ncbi:MAG: hypothetical protein HYU51_01740 [Candidatus Rokubacteria bacterium]|nr:hypothetical protein [Candidatus Rokubacteria bacterium]
MKTATVVTSVFVAALMIAGTAAWAQYDRSGTKSQTSQPAASPGMEAPKRIEGQVTAVDLGSGMITLRTDDGQTHQFRGSQETLRDYKVGDRIELSLRPQPNR